MLGPAVVDVTTKLAVRCVQDGDITVRCYLIPSLPILPLLLSIWVTVDFHLYRVRLEICALLINT